MAVLARRLDLQFQLLEAPPILKPAITPRIVESGEGEAIRNLRAVIRRKSICGFHANGVDAG